MKEIKIDEITTKNKYLRLNDDVDNLIESIKAVGLIHPVSINKDNELIAGGRRYTAVKELGWTKIPAIVVDRSIEEQELISIDENIVRKSLNKLELENAFNRGREIYEELNPEANKVEMKVKTLTPEEKKIQKEEEELDETSFAAITSQKTGLSKSVIKSAIRRDALSSKKVKEARSSGDISASQANEIIRLSKKEQESILPHIKDKTVKDVRKIITQLKENGVESAIDYSENMNPPPREIIELVKAVKKMNKSLSKVLIEEIEFEGKEMDILKKEITILDSLMRDYSGITHHISPSNSSTTQTNSIH